MNDSDPDMEITIKLKRSAWFALLNAINRYLNSSPPLIEGIGLDYLRNLLKKAGVR